MTNTISTLAHIPAIAPAVSKKGRVTLAAQRAANAANAASPAALLGMAQAGDRAAKARLNAVAFTFDLLVSLDNVDGSQWADICGVLASHFKLPHNGYSKRAAHALIESARAKLEFDRAERDRACDWTEALEKRFAQRDADVSAAIAAAGRWAVATQAAIDAAAAAQAAAEAGLTDTMTEATA